MAEQIQELLRKIQEDGIQAAEAKAGEVERLAREKADALIAAAQAQAGRMIADAQARINKLEASSRASLEQAGRDMLLTLRRSIIGVLDRLINAQVRAALTPEELGRIIAGLVKEYGAPEKAGVAVTLSPQDKEKLEGAFLQKLKDHLKHGLTVQASGDIQAGFVISFDAGKSHFDFSDQALTEFICAHLKPGLAALLNPKA